MEAAEEEVEERACGVDGRAREEDESEEAEDVIEISD
jgi:hypothetical protein